MTEEAPSSSLAIPQPRYQLGEDEVHVWQASLKEPTFQVGPWFRLLNSEERNRAERFRFERDRTEFCLAHAILRLLLESYGIAPAAEIQFTYSARGKPELAAVHHYHRLQFNLSHTRGMAVYALTRSRPVGIDVERIREVDYADRLIETRFAPEEQLAYRQLPLKDRPRAFFNAWTRKEAFIKALGEGLSYPLDAFAVTFQPGEPERFIRIGDQPAGSGAWQLTDLTIDPAYVVALAVCGRNLRLENKVWKGS